MRWKNNKRNMPLQMLNPFDPQQPFPNPETALTEPNGLLAVGGCLSVQRLLNAYRHGIFPWYNDNEPILWWSPDPRLVIVPGQEKISRSLKKTRRKGIYRVTFDQCFAEVMAACAAPRKDTDETWITEEILEAYKRLHQHHIAHSVEVWNGDALAGGLYGVAIGQVFFGESMFHRQTDASKIAFVTLMTYLRQWGYQLVDCQVRSEHLVSLGAKEIARAQFNALLQRYCSDKVSEQAWKNA